jgi:hypothetical protein
MLVVGPGARGAVGRPGKGGGRFILSESPRLGNVLGLQSGEGTGLKSARSSRREDANLLRSWQRLLLEPLMLERRLCRHPLGRIIREHCL